MIPIKHKLCASTLWVCTSTYVYVLFKLAIHIFNKLKCYFYFIRLKRNHFGEYEYVLYYPIAKESNYFSVYVRIYL